jgi:hypothetical protein
MAVPVYMPDGRISRVLDREAIIAGKTYVTCRCKACGARLHLFLLPDHPPWGTVPPFVGGGKLSLACRFCKHDTLYETDEFFVAKAEVDLPSAYAPRVEPSDMPRQKLLRTKHKAALPTFGPETLEDRPKAAALIARIIGISSEIDAAVAFLMGRMMKANTAPAMALYLSLRNARAQADALNAVARVVLNDPDRELFAALMSLRSGSDNERDALAHGRFGEAPAITEGVVWVDSFDYLQYELRVEAANAVTEADMQWFRERMFVYEVADLERIARASEALYHSIRSFTGYLSSDDAAWRAERYPQLCAEPHVQQALFQLREGAKKRTQEPPTPPPSNRQPG